MLSLHTSRGSSEPKFKHAGEMSGWQLEGKVPPFDSTFVMGVLAAINVALEKGYHTADDAGELPAAAYLPVPEAELQPSVIVACDDEVDQEGLCPGTILVYTVESMPDESRGMGLELPVALWAEEDGTAKVSQNDFCQCLREIGQQLLHQVQADDGSPIDEHEDYYGSVYYPAIRHAATSLMMGDPWQDGSEAWAIRGIRMSYRDAYDTMWRNERALESWGQPGLRTLSNYVDRSESLVDWWATRGDRMRSRTNRIERDQMGHQEPIPF